MTQTNQKTTVQRRIRRHFDAELGLKENTSYYRNGISSYIWQFRDSNNVWITYGQAATGSEPGCVTTATSEYIEECYNSDPNTVFNIGSRHHKYELNFKKMTQTNVETRVQRPMRRLPWIQVPNSTIAEMRRLPRIQLPNSTIAEMRGLPRSQLPNPTNLPPHWTAMTSNELVKTVPLSQFDTEYTKNMSLIKKTHPNFNINQMYRIQNPYLWKAYVNMKECMETRYHIHIREKHLFHSTNANNAKSICERNLDWRLHGSNVGQGEGRGAYFSNNAAFSAGYGSGPLKAMFIMKVLIGRCIEGTWDTVIPPTRSGVTYDTTVDNEANPKIFVKYDSQEYYPAYYAEYE